MSFRRASRERLRAELADAIQHFDVQRVHTVLADNHGDATDLDAVIGTSAAAQMLRAALVEDYRAWAAEMAEDDVADEIPGVLMVLDQPDLWSAVSS
ncbi:hypothetical protein ADL26_07910 [Thermoactinomyces vulgaris]|nr:hypothetical protein ADL26_07910 [Thermoactinomyces vulgaris]